MTEFLRMPTAAGDGIGLLRYEDVIFTDIGMTDPAVGIKSAKEFKYRPGDIIMCGYPKCGSHWLGNMIWKLKTFDSSKRPEDAFLEFSASEIFDNMESPRIIFTHLKPSRLPTDHLRNKGKIVLMLRNPKDAMVSCFHHTRDAIIFQNKQTWNEFFESYTSGIIPMGSYFDYVQQWEEFLKDKPTDQAVEVFYYEDFKANLNYNIARLNFFLGFNRDQTYIEKVKEETTLLALRAQDAAGERGTLATELDKNGDSIIFRKGKVGAWKSYLTVAQSEIIDKLLKYRLKYGIINIKYEI